MSPKISHPSMKRARDSSVQTPQPETFVVDDATVEQPQAAQDLVHSGPPFGAPEEIKPVEQRVEESKITPKRKNILEGLIFLGRATQEVDISGHTFLIRTLTHKEHSTLMQKIFDVGNADIFTLRTMTLSLALQSIDNIPIGQLDMEETFDSVEEKKVALVDNLQMNVVVKLYEAYDKLVAATDKELESAEIKN